MRYAPVTTIAQDVSVFLAKDPGRLRHVLAQAKAPLKDAAAVNSTRWALFESLKATKLVVSVASGGRTKFNRTTQGLPNTHALDAACVGDVSSFTRGYLMRTKLKRV